MSIWKECQGERYFRKLEEHPWRVVEAQHVLSSRDLVDSNEEHDLLEELLEDSKPYVEKEKGYLIFTPFRYPPLQYGSRFGSIYEPSLWYGSLEIETAFAETAYYRRMFLNDTSANLGYIELTLTLFRTSLRTDLGIDLTLEPFFCYRKQLASKNSYQHTQPLGTEMRDAGVAAFLFFSARKDNGAINVAAFTPDVFCTKNSQYITNQQTWQCIANREVVEFVRSGFVGDKRYHFRQEPHLNEVFIT
jgi:hypothetical protein